MPAAPVHTSSVNTFNLVRLLFIFSLSLHIHRDFIKKRIFFSPVSIIISPSVRPRDRRTVTFTPSPSFRRPAMRVKLAFNFAVEEIYKKKKSYFSTRFYKTALFWRGNGEDYTSRCCMLPGEEIGGSRVEIKFRSADRNLSWRLNIPFPHLPLK